MCKPVYGLKLKDADYSVRIFRFPLSRTIRISSQSERVKITFNKFYTFVSINQLSIINKSLWESIERKIVGERMNFSHSENCIVFKTSSTLFKINFSNLFSLLFRWQPTLAQCHPHLLINCFPHAPYFLFNGNSFPFYTQTPSSAPLQPTTHLVVVWVAKGL